MEVNLDNLEGGGDRYRYFHHTQYPLVISVKEEGDVITVEIVKMFKQHIVKELTKSSKVLQKMTKEQKENYILDVVEIFLKK